MIFAFYPTFTDFHNLTGMKIRVQLSFDGYLFHHKNFLLTFCRKYGEQLPDGTWQIPPAWQAGLSNGANVGEIIGLFINGFVSEKFGYRYTVMTCLTLIIGFTAIFFTAQTVIDLQVAEVLCGIPWGVFQTLTITYASEVCPVALRGYCKLERFRSEDFG